MNIWGRFWLYRLYIIVGLPMMIALTVFLTLRSDPYEPEILPILAPVLVWVAGLLILQWASLLSDGVGPVAPEGEESPPETADRPLDLEALRTVLRVGGRYASSAPTPSRWANVRVTAANDGVLLERDADPGAAFQELWLDERLVSAAENRI